MTHLSRILTALALLILVPSAAFAHAHLQKSTPAANGVVKTAPDEVTLWFTEALEPDFCTVEVVDAAGTRVDQGHVAIDAADRKILHVALKPLAPGSYKATWKAVSVDSHTTNGNFAFKVAP